MQRVERKAEKIDTNRVDRLGWPCDFDLLSSHTTFMAVSGFFRQNGFFTAHGIRLDDIAAVISRHLKYQRQNVQFGDVNRIINKKQVSHQGTIAYSAVLNEKIAVAIFHFPSQMLSFDTCHYIYFT